MTNEPVRVIAGRYRLIAPQGEGGMATVWRAMDEQLGREVAIKILRPQFGADPDFAARFRNEARAAGALSHPNVVQVYDFGTDVDSGDQYIVMQLVDGKDLATVMRERGPLEIDEAVAIGAAVADALDAAHRGGLVHRDIKPGNILLTEGGRTLVADFGISRAIAEASMTATGMTIGSVHYFSPEQAAGEEVGPSSDIYALGIVVYEMLSGRRPFEGDSAAGVALKRLNEPPPPLSTAARPIPAPLEGVVMRALVRDPAQRFPDAAAFSHTLRNWRSNEDTAAMVAAAAVVAAAVVPPPLDPTQPPAAVTPTEPPEKEKRPWWIWLLAILAVIMLGAMGFLAAQLLGDERAEPSPSAETFALPDWEGEPITQVRIEAEDLGIELRERPENDEDVPEDSVIRTQPPAGAQVAEGDTITVYVSSGGETVDVPRLVGQTRDEANATLVQAQLVLGSVSEEFSEQPEGTVIRSSPAEGTTIPVGDQVDIVLSRGPEPTPTPQPTPPPTPPPTPTPPPPDPSPS